MKTAQTTNRFKWNKSALIETDLYIKLYIEALNQFLSPDDKQALFMISKYFTDGAAEVGRNRISMAEYYFKQGEVYFERAPDNSLLKQVITNVYDRSKSFYFHRTGHSETAIALINNTLRNNKVLEGQGFRFLVFDRVQQYHNLSRVYFSLGDTKKGFELLAGITCFLIKGSSTLLPDLNENFLTDYTDDLKRTKFYMLCQILFETTEHLQKTKDAAEFRIESSQYFPAVIEAAADYLILVPEDKLVKKWILILGDFYAQRYKRFYVKVTRYLHDEPRFHNGLSHASLKAFLKFIPH